MIIYHIFDILLYCVVINIIQNSDNDYHHQLTSHDKEEHDANIIIESRRNTKWIIKLHIIIMVLIIKFIMVLIIKLWY